MGDIEKQHVPEMLVRMRLVPVEAFTGMCEHVECANPDHLGYGLCDAVSAWSDCNRARGRIYRVDDESAAQYRLPGDTIEIWVNAADVAWFERRFGT